MTPLEFVHRFRDLYPQFASQRNGSFQQQDADECWGTFCQLMKNKLVKPDGRNIYDDLFTGEMTETLTCVENPDDVSVDKTPFSKLPCYVGKEVIEALR